MPPRYDEGVMTERVFTLMPLSMLKAIDEWRAKQPGVPNRSEAIRRLVEIALRAK